MAKNVKVAVYAIALNEEKFVEKWYNSVKDEADYILIADTGSTDKTVEIAESLGINVVHIKVKPWRFDVGRNASLAALPLDIDYCIPLDLDEIMLPGWKAEMQKALDAGATRPRYKYIWNWKEDGTPGVTFEGDKIHARVGYLWKNPVHECLCPDRIPEIQYHSEAVMEHHADNTKSRGQYLPLLKQSVMEDPYNDRNAFYYGRELFFYVQYEESKKELLRYLALPTATWAPERAAAMILLGQIDKDNSEDWFTKAIKEAPGRREAIVHLAKHYYATEEWQGCYEQATAALAITQMPLEYLCEPEAWGYLPHDLAAIAAFRLGKYSEALQFGKEAVEKAPDEEKKRVEENYTFYEAMVKTLGE